LAKTLTPGLPRELWDGGSEEGACSHLSSSYPSSPEAKATYA